MAGPNDGIDTSDAQKAINSQSAQTKKLVKGTKGLAEAFGNTAITFATGLPSLKDSFESTGKFGKAIGYLEGQLGVFNDMSQYGVTFSGELDKMTTMTTAARMTQEQLTKTIKAGQGDFQLFGATANQGLQTFLKNQANFYDTMPLAATSLRRLGMSTEEINESMLTYDKISRLNNRRDQRNNIERNASAAAFAEEMDMMAKLQGRSRKELQKEMEARAREGRIIALKSGMEQDMADALDQNLQRAAAFSPAMESLMKDMMAIGVPSKENAKLFAMVGPEVQSAIKAMKAAQDAGDVTEYNRQMSIFMASMEKRGKNEDIRRLALLGGMNEYAQTAGDIISNTSTGMGAALADARATLEAEVAAGKRRAFTEEEVTKLAKQRVADEQAALKKSGGEGSSKAVSDAIIAGQMKVFQVAEKVQIDATTKLYTELSSAASGFQKQLTEFDASKIVTDIGNFFGTIKEFAVGIPNIADIRQQIEQARKTAIGSGDVESLARIKELEQQLQQAKPEDRQAIMDEIMSLGTKINSINVNGDTTVNGNDIFVNGQQVGEVKDTGIPEMNNGSVGAFGTLFKDFGKETVAALHGEEMVANKAQMSAGLQAFAKELKPGLTSVGSELQGKVSNIRPQAQNMASSMAPQIEEMAKTMQSSMPDIQSQMAGFAEQMKAPMEKMAKLTEEQLTVTKKGVNINDKQLKSAKAMIGNVFGGIG